MFEVKDQLWTSLAFVNSVTCLCCWIGVEFPRMACVLVVFVFVVRFRVFFVDVEFSLDFLVGGSSVSDVELVFVVSFGFSVEFVGRFSFVVVVGLKSVFELSVFGLSLFVFRYSVSLMLAFLLFRQRIFFVA